MKNILLLLALSLSFVLPIFSQFEGEINMKLNTDLGEKMQDHIIVMLIKNQMLSIAGTGESGMDRHTRVIFREDKKVMWVVNDSQKTAMEIPTKAIEAMGAKTPKDAHPDKVKYRKSGKSETILGYPCEGWIVEEDDETKEVYGTTKLGNIYEGFLNSMKRMSGGRMESMMNEFEVEMMKQKIFPLKAITKRDGKITMSQEVTKIDRRSLATSLFEVPSSYKKTNMGAQMEGVMKQMQEQMRQAQQEGKMTPEMQKMMEEQMKQLEKYQTKSDSSEEHEE